MDYNVLFQFLFLFIFTTVSSLGISSKLDFGDTSSAKLLVASSQYKNPREYKISKKEENQNFDKIGVICTSNGCNATKPVTGLKNTVKTDVLVHVQTNVALDNENKTALSIETPDIPVILGTKNKEDRLDSENYPLIIPALTPPESVFPDFMYGLSGLNPDRSYLENPNININIKTLPPITDNQYIKSINLKSNNDNFHPTYSNHYFSENPPPQLDWFPKENVVNPVEFQNVQKSLWNPSIWDSKLQSSHRHENLESCSCKNYQTGLQWYPRRRINQKENPGVQINDKLAPLN